MRTRLATAAVVITSALGVLGTACADSGESRLSVGDTGAGPSRVEGEVVEVRVPSGAITLTLGAPQQSVTTGEGLMKAPDGGALIAVSWSIDRYQTADVVGFDQGTTLALVTGDDQVDVATIPDTSAPAIGSRLVAVEGDAPIETVTATYDGLGQRISLDGTRDAGVAEELYEPAAAGERTDCDRGWRLRPQADLDLECSVRAWTLPYLPDVGWADEGTTHVLIEPTVSLLKATAGNQQYRATFRSATATVGDQPVDTGATGPSSFTGRFQVESATVPLDWRVTATFGLRSRVGNGPLDDTDVELSGGASAP